MAHFQRNLADPKFRRLYESESVKVRLGFAFNQLRNKAGLTHAKLARRAGVTPTYVARLETGDLRRYEIDMLSKVAAALHKMLVIGFADKPKRKGSALQSKSLKVLAA